VRKIEEEGPDSGGISGIRTPVDAEVLKSRFGKEFLLVHVEIMDPEIRFHRLRKRRDPRDPKDFEEFLVHDWREEELFHINETIQTADITLDNDGSLEELHRQIEKKILAGFLKKDY
jgi:dephospho-CoA kinase